MKRILTTAAAALTATLIGLSIPSLAYAEAAPDTSNNPTLAAAIADYNDKMDQLHRRDDSIAVPTTRAFLIYSSYGKTTYEDRQNVLNTLNDVLDHYQRNANEYRSVLVAAYDNAGETAQREAFLASFDKEVSPWITSFNEMLTTVRNTKVIPGTRPTTVAVNAVVPAGHKSERSRAEKPGQCSARRHSFKHCDS